MKRALSLLGGLGLGAGLMYFLDPQQGRRRRALVRDQSRAALHDAEDALRVAGRDLAHRASGLAAEAQSLLTSEPISDRALTERVRAHMGHVISHPHAIQVSAHNGRVTLSGPILADEVDDLLSCVASVRGVQGVENRLGVHPQPGTVPGLQGGSRQRSRTTLLPRTLTPAARLLSGAAGASLVGVGLTRRFPVACILGTAGLALMAPALALVAGGLRRFVEEKRDRSGGQENIPGNRPLQEAGRF